MSFRWQRKEEPAPKAWLLCLSRENSISGEWCFPEVVSSLVNSCGLMAGSVTGSIPISAPALLNSRVEKRSSTASALPFPVVQQ